jgi:hypothetical protein
MEEIAYVFSVNPNVVYHMENPTKQQIIKYGHELPNFDNLYVSFKNGTIKTFKDYIFYLISLVEFK